MSRSTEIRVSITMTSLEYTFGTGSIAEKHGILTPGGRTEYRGAAVRKLLEADDFLPAEELEFVRKILARHDAEMKEFQEPYDLDYGLWAVVKMFD